jgi:hypothetical protein
VGEKMKVRCKKIISEITKKDLGNVSPWVTLDKEYIVLAIDIESQNITILIQSDGHYEPFYSSLDGFEIVDQQIPSNWGIKISDFYDQVIYQMMPKIWMYDSFFEEVEDEDPKAIALFNAETEIIYREAGWVF